MGTPSSLLKPPLPLTAGGRVFDIEHISHDRLSKQPWIDFSDMFVFLCRALGLGSGGMRCLQRAGGAPRRFKRLEVGHPEESNRYVLSGKGLTRHWSRPNRSWGCTRPPKSRGLMITVYQSRSWISDSQKPRRHPCARQNSPEVNCWVKLLLWTRRTKGRNVPRVRSYTGFCKIWTISGLYWDQQYIYIFVGPLSYYLKYDLWGLCSAVFENIIKCNMLNRDFVYYCWMKWKVFLLSQLL